MGEDGCQVRRVECADDVVEVDDGVAFAQGCKEAFPQLVLIFYKLAGGNFAPHGDDGDDAGE